MRFLALAALILFPLTAEADFAACRADKALLEQALKGNAAYTSNRPLTREDGWCIQRDIRVDDRDATLRVRVETLRWKRTGLSPNPNAWPESGRLELHAEGIRTHAISGPPLLDYGLRIQSQPASGRFNLIAAFDAETQTVRLERAELELSERNSIALSDTVFTVGPTFTSSPVVFTQMRLQGLSLAVQSHGLFESTAFLPLLMSVGDMEEDPEPQINALRKEARTHLAGLPQELMGYSSRQALGTLLGDLPNPWGKVFLRVEAPNGFGAANLTPMLINPGPDALNTVLSSLRLGVEYTRSPR